MAKSLGEILRNKREEKKLSLEQAAAGTNIRIQFLQAIEEGKIGAIASQAQFRGFTRLYASFLGINPLALFELETSEVEIEKPVVDSPAITPESPDKKKVGRSNSIFNKTLPKESQSIEPVRKLPREDTKTTPVSNLIFEEIGAELQRQREALSLSRADVERQIKIRELYIYALENGQVNELPSTVQGRGMLNNYASFMSLDPEVLQMRFAEGLQQRRLEIAADEIAQKSSKVIKKYSSPITGWRRYLTPDLLLGVSVFSVLFILVVWGAWQVIGTTRQQQLPTADSISSILVGTNTLSVPIRESTPLLETPGIKGTKEIVNTASVDILATINSVNSGGSIQVVVVAYQRAFLRIVSDGKEVFVGRIVPGNVYTYTGSAKITLTTGNAAAMQVYYNQEDLGILGVNGQVANLEFTSKGVVTPTPQFTATPTATKPATLTPQPTNTLRPTPTVPTMTVTPYKPKP
ncbi:MAG: hypothetical protein C0401_00305 [Anaerolinea sp.]|nr:hypothetical protein [Anaerolinea sp.]